MPTGEQPRCQTCGHRRIFHSLLIGDGHAGRRRIEIMVPCSLRDCDCARYVAQVPNAHHPVSTLREPR